MMNEGWRAYKKFWLGPVSSIRLDVFRFALGFSLLLYMVFRWWYAGEWLTDAGFHVSSANLPYFDFAVPLLPLWLLPAFGIIYFGSIVAFTLGWQLKWTSWLLLVGLVYVSAADQLAFFSPNKILIASIFILAASTLGGYARRQGDQTSVSSAWSLRILQLTAMIHLFMAGIVKISNGGEWLIKDYVFWTQAQGTYRTDFAAFMLNTIPDQGWTFMQWSALLFELMFPFLLFIKRLRWIAILWGIVFQLMIALTMQHLIYFNLIMISFLVLFINEDRLHAMKAVFTLSAWRKAPLVPENKFNVTPYD